MSILGILRSEGRAGLSDKPFSIANLTAKIRTALDDQTPVPPD